MTELVFLLEEPSAAEMLKGLLPRIVPPEVSFRLVPFEGKQQLEGQLVRRIRGYRVPDARFIVIRDQDHGDCRVIKAKLQSLCVQAGQPSALVRIACRELESWYLGDLAAVERGLGLSGLARKKLGDPDAIGAPAWELERMTGGQYQKISGSRAIGGHLDPDRSRSASFRTLIAGIRAVVAAGA